MAKTPYSERCTYRLRKLWEPARQAAYRTRPLRGGKYVSDRTCNQCNGFTRYIVSDLCVSCACKHSLRQRLASDIVPTPTGEY